MGRNRDQVAFIGPGGHVTEYVYGVQQSGLFPSKITSNDLLRKIEYPGNPGGIPSDLPVTTFAYNLAGEVITLEDPNATEHDYTRDLLGRVTVDHASVIAAGIDTTIDAIATAYDDLGRPTFVKSHRDFAGAATVVNAVEFSYDSLWQIVDVKQQHDADIGGSSLKATYAYDIKDVGNGNYTRMKSLTYPNSSSIRYGYGSLSSSDRKISRLVTIGRILCDHIGLGMFSKVDLPADVVLDRNFYPDGTKPNGDYGGFDRFGRIKRQMWVDGDFTTGTGDNPDRPPLVDIALAYDEASNRLEALNENDVLSQWVIRDYHYTCDGLDRLDVAQRGQDTGPGFTYAPFDSAYMPSEDWTLDAVGDWNSHETDRDQSGDFDFDDDSDDRTHNIRHEILTRGILINEDPFNPDQYVLSHDTDLAGNMISQEVADGAPAKPKFVYTHDAWNRLVKVEFVDETPPDVRPS